MASQTFDGVSVSEQRRKECVLHLQLSDMKTAKSGIGRFAKYKPTNTDLPTPICTDETVIVTAVVNKEGSPPTTYLWEKNHGGKIIKCEVKAFFTQPEDRQLKVILTKKEAQDWVGAFLDHLQEI